MFFKECLRNVFRGGDRFGAMLIRYLIAVPESRWPACNDAPFSVAVG